jgi:hypothetical protein
MVCRTEIFGSAYAVEVRANKAKIIVFFMRDSYFAGANPAGYFS